MQFEFADCQCAFGQAACLRTFFYNLTACLYFMVFAGAKSRRPILQQLSQYRSIVTADHSLRLSFYSAGIYCPVGMPATLAESLCSFSANDDRGYGSFAGCTDICTMQV